MVEAGAMRALHLATKERRRAVVVLWRKVHLLSAVEIRINAIRRCLDGSVLGVRLPLGLCVVLLALACILLIMVVSPCLAAFLFCVLVSFLRPLNRESIDLF